MRDIKDLIVDVLLDRDLLVEYDTHLPKDYRYTVKLGPEVAGDIAEAILRVMTKRYMELLQAHASNNGQEK